MDIPENIRPQLADAYQPRTGEVIVNGEPLMVVDPKLDDWVAAFRVLLARHVIGKS